MNHQEVSARLSEFYDGELVLEEREPILAHVKGCAECRTSYESWGRIAQSLFSAPPPLATRAFTDKVMARFEEKEELPARPLWVWRLPAYGLGFAVALLLVNMARDGESVSAEALLMESEDGTPAEWLARPSAPGADELLGFVMGAP